MIVYEDFHFGKEKHMAFYHLRDFSHFAHMHRSYELLWLKEGQLAATVDQRRFAMQPGDFILILPYEIHAYEDGGGSVCEVVVFSPDYIQEFYNQTAQSRLECPVFRLSGRDLEQLRELLFCDRARLYGSKSCLYGIVDQITLQTRFSDRPQAQTDLLHRILTFVQENYREPLTLEILAEHLGYNRLYLSRYINQSLRMSFTDLLHEHRVCHAGYLLRNTEMSVSEAAFACGFGSLRTFNRCFSEITGKTPREYRQESQTSENRTAALEMAAEQEETARTGHLPH